MADKFISAVTDEAMQRICYNGGGWELTPYRFIVSDTDILNGATIYDSSGDVTEEVKTILKEYTSNMMMNDSGNWCELPFSSLTKDSTKQNTLTHHLVIPANQTTTEKDIKTIYFVYKPHEGEAFLYAVAVAPTAIIFEPGLTQSLFFNFTVNNEYNTSSVSFTINYTYPQEIEDHNNDTEAHSSILSKYVLRDGSRTISNPLMYSTEMQFTNNYQLVSKAYVDNLINTLKANNNLT